MQFVPVASNAQPLPGHWQTSGAMHCPFSHPLRDYKFLNHHHIWKVENLSPWTDRRTHIVNFQKPFPTFTHFRSDAITVHTAFAAKRLTCPVGWEWIAFVASALFWCRTVSVKATIRTLWNAKFLCKRFQNKSFSAGASVVLIANSVATHNRARRQTKSSQVSNMIGEANASLRSCTKAINTFAFTWINEQRISFELDWLEL